MGFAGGGSRAKTTETDEVDPRGPDPQSGRDEDPVPHTEAELAVEVCLVDTRTGAVVQHLTSNSQLDADMLNNPYLSVICVPPAGTAIGSVHFDFQDGAITRTESFEPYALFGDVGGGLLAPSGAMFTESGTYNLSVEVFEQPGGQGATLASLDLSMQVPEGDALDPRDETDPINGPITDPVQDPDPDPVQDPDPIPDPDPDPVQDPDPIPDPDPDPAPEGEVDDPNPEPPQQGGSGDGEDQGETPIAEGAVEVMAGRVATLLPDGTDVASVRILNDVNHGTLTVNPDNSLALVMTQSDYVGGMNFSYEITHTDGSTSVHNVDLNVIPGAQEGGWGTSESHYMLETDADDRVIVEHGDNHVKVYVSASSDALSLSDIASIEGLSVSQITGSWLAAHPEYGQSEATALAEDAGTLLWRAVTPPGSETSNWLLLERGYQYDELLHESDGVQRLLMRDTSGESELNPLYIGAWGTGDLPEITNRFMQYQESTTNLVIQDIHFTDGLTLLDAENVILDSIKTTGNMIVIQEGGGVTLRNSEIYDSILERSHDGGSWDPGDRMQGMYADAVDGLLLEGLFFDHNGWADGYDPAWSGSAGQPMSMYNHNMYIDATNTDVTLRDTITMRASSYGAQIRSGGFIEDNAFIDNNAGLSFYGGDYYDHGAIGQYTLAADNIFTSAAYKEGYLAGALTWGIYDQGQLSSLVDNIIAHLADPNNPAEQAWKDWTQEAYQGDGAYYNDTIIYNWQGNLETWRAPDENVGGLDTAVLDQTTIQLFTQQLLGDPNATIADLADYLRAQGDGLFADVVDADLIIRFFQSGFGLAPDLRATEATLRFIPNELGDGVRWDNRLNWDSDDLPGTVAGDSVDLGGNHVTFGTNATIDTLDFGDGGALNVYGGKLEATGQMTGDGGHLNVEGAGQAWMDGSDGSDIDVTVSGGRFVNTGEMSGVDMLATGGEVILASGGAEFDVSDGHTLEVDGSGVEVGFADDTSGIAILDLADDATVKFTADSGGLGTIEEIGTGVYGDDPSVKSGIDLGGSTLRIDLSEMSSSMLDELLLMSSDELIGVFDEAIVDGLGSRDATIKVDYLSDTVSLELSHGSGVVSIEMTGEEDNVSSGYGDVWDALTVGHGVVTEALVAEEEEPQPEFII